MMSHPFRRYCFHLGEKLGKTLNEIMELDSSEISGWMAYDLTNDEGWSKKYGEEKELNRQREMSNEDKAKLFKQLLGGG